MNNATQHVINAFQHPALKGVVCDRFDAHRARKVVLAALPNGPYEFTSRREYRDVNWQVVATFFNQMAL